jgi:hypothetical protein
MVLRLQNDKIIGGNKSHPTYVFAFDKGHYFLTTPHAVASILTIDISRDFCSKYS